MRYTDPGRRHTRAEPALIKRRRAAVEAGARLNRSPEARERNAWYHTPEWRALRKQVLAEERVCRFCGAEASHVDHIEHGADWKAHFFERANLRALCAPCHNSRSARERVEKMRGR